VQELDCRHLNQLAAGDLAALAALPCLRSLALRGNYRTGDAELAQVRPTRRPRRAPHGARCPSARRPARRWPP